MRNNNQSDKFNLSIIYDKKSTSINKIIDPRPISANITRVGKAKNTRNIQDYPIIYQQNSFIIETSPNYLFSKVKHTPTNIDGVDKLC